MPQRSSDYQLGQLYAERLASRRPIEPSMALNILQDLMGADVSLLPSIRLLASQPTFFQLINAKPSEVLLPQRDALLTAAQEILAPALVKRITNFFDGYLNSGSDQSEAPPFSEPQTQLKEDSPKGSSFPPVLGREAYELPKTVVAESNRSSDAQSTSKQISSPRASFPPVLSNASTELPNTVVDEGTSAGSPNLLGPSVKYDVPYTPSSNFNQANNTNFSNAEKNKKKRFIRGAVIGGIIGIAAPIFLAIANESVFIIKRLDQGTLLYDTIQICAFERRWYPLYPKVIHAPGCKNNTFGILPGLIAVSAIGGGVAGCTLSYIFRK